MIDKTIRDLNEAISIISDGATVLVSGFGEAGNPTELVHALIDHGVRDLTVVNNNAGNGHVGLAALIEAGRVVKMICSFPRSSASEVFETMYQQGRVKLEVIPQGTLAERLRAAGAGLGGFYTKTTIGTPLARDKERRTYKGEEFVLEEPLEADFALVKADTGDRWGNLTYRMSARNFGPVMCMAAKITIVQVRKLIPLGDIPPENVVTPGIFVDRIVEVPDPVSERAMIECAFVYEPSETA